jgi:hypothetical protein
MGRSFRETDLDRLKSPDRQRRSLNDEYHYCDMNRRARVRNSFRRSEASGMVNIIKT